MQAGQQIEKEGGVVGIEGTQPLGNDVGFVLASGKD